MDLIRYKYVFDFGRVVEEEASVNLKLFGRCRDRVLILISSFYVDLPQNLSLPLITGDDLRPGMLISTSNILYVVN